MTEQEKEQLEQDIINGKVDIDDLYLVKIKYLGD